MMVTRMAVNSGDVGGGGGGGGKESDKEKGDHQKGVPPRLCSLFERD